MRIRLLGGLEIVSLEGQPIRFATRKASLLLAALVLSHGRALRRDQLAEVFWPGRSQSQARNSLRQALVDLRRWFRNGNDNAVHIDGDQETVSLMAAPGETDIEVFDRRIEGRSTDLAVAADLYRGDVLAGEVFSDDLDEWFRPHQSRYQRKALQLVEQLSLARPAPGSSEEGACEALADRLLAADASAEAAHRALIRVYASRGQENMALRQFELCRAALKKHLDVEPEAQTKALAQSLRARGLEWQGVPVPALDASAHRASPGRQRDLPSVAVLPFQNMSGDGDQDFFADGIVEDITTALTRFRNLIVIAKGSSFAYKGRPFDLGHVGRELDVRYVVEGSVRRAGDRLRITAQLVDTSTGAHLWADRFDGTLAEVFDLQQDIASSIVGAITPTVESAEIERTRRKPTESLDAYDYYLRGLAIFDRSAVSRPVTDEALRLFMAAITRDPEFAVAYARAARCYATRKSNRWMIDPTAEIAEATRLARRAVELGRDDAVALAFGGFVLGYVGGDLEEGAACIERALELNPNSANALGFSSWVSACRGEPEKAIDHAKRAMRLSPLDYRQSAWQTRAALAHFCAGRYDEAIASARAALRSTPGYSSATRIAAASYALAGRSAEASEMVARLRELDPTLRLVNLADVLPPFRRLEDRDRMVEALSQAGLE